MWWLRISTRPQHWQIRAELAAPFFDAKALISDQEMTRKALISRPTCEAAKTSSGPDRQRFELALQQNLGHASAIENIDIGGPCMVRASAKSHQGCAILSDPSACSRRQKLLDLKTRAVVIDANRNSFEYMIKFSVAVVFFFGPGEEVF